MIYEIIYANRDRGYDLYDRSPGFPTEYLSEIRTVCGRLCGQGTPDNYARHFAFLPLTGNMCLFAVIIRQPRGNAGEKRAHSMVLNLVCSNEDAAFLLGRPAFLFSAMENAAKEDLASSGSVLPVYETPEELLSLSGEIQRPSRIPAESLQKVLLMSLFYAGEGKPGQVMISLQEPSAAPECLCWLLPMVPEEVRPRLSFHTGIQTASEGIGCILKFCTEKGLRPHAEDRIRRRRKSRPQPLGRRKADLQRQARPGQSLPPGPLPFGGYGLFHLVLPSGKSRHRRRKHIFT